MSRKERASGVPAGTETEEWRVMSARIAYLLWSCDERILLPSETRNLGVTWEEIAAEYRATVRFVLRMLEKEGIYFKEQKGSAMYSNDKDWWKKTARFAWLLWMRSNRQKGRIPQHQELTVWNEEATQYRTFIRAAVKKCEAEGIFLQL
jgi:hypothetical protein